jgi:hypothetical protein
MIEIIGITAIIVVLILAVSHQVSLATLKADVKAIKDKFDPPKPAVKS